MTPYLACLLFFFLLLLFPILIPFTVAQKVSSANVPMAYRAAQAVRYSDFRGLAIDDTPSSVKVNSTSLEEKQPLRITCTETPYRINIYDSKDKLIYQKKITTSSVSVKTDTLQSGLYRVEIDADEREYTYHISIK